MAERTSLSGSESDFEFIETPRAPSPTFEKFEECGVRTTQYPSIKNGPLPADGSSSFPGGYMIGFMVLVPLYLSWRIGGGLLTAVVVFAPFTTVGLFLLFWFAASALSPRRNEKVTLPGRPVEYYLTFKREADRAKYRGKNRVPMYDFLELYFEGNVEFNGDCLEVMEYRHEWATPRFTLQMGPWFFLTFLPEVIMHTRSQDEEQVRGHYDRGDDFYGWFLGPRMVYTSGIVSDIRKEETLEQLQDNKLAIVCDKIDLQTDDVLLDIGCGWGTLVKFASQNFGARATGITLGRNQTAWGNAALRKVGISEDQSKILCLDYRDIPVPPSRYTKITCLEMAEHVGVRYFSRFMSQVYDMLDDDGVFFLQIAGLRKSWQYEDLIWGIFMNKYIFPGADASTPLYWFINKAESAGFEIKSVDTIGVHYSATIWRWYRNWLANRDKVEAKYGKRWFRIWEFFLSWSTITSRQGGASCYQIVMIKNLNSTHRVEGIPNQRGLHGALAATKVDMKAWAESNKVTSSSEVIH